MNSRRSFMAGVCAGATSILSMGAANAEQITTTIDTIGDVKKVRMHYVFPTVKKRPHLKELRDSYRKHIHSFSKYILRRYYCMSLRGEVTWIKHLPYDIHSNAHRFFVYIDWPIEYGEPFITAHPNMVWEAPLLADHGRYIFMLSSPNNNGGFKPYTLSGDEGSMYTELYKTIGPFVRPIKIVDHLPCDDIEILETLTYQHI